MKGAVSLPTELLVGIVLAVILILVGLMAVGIIPPLWGQQSDKGYFESCCIAYNIGMHCGENAADYTFECKVDTSMSSTGKMAISELAGRAGLPVESCCRK